MSMSASPTNTSASITPLCKSFCHAGKAGTALSSPSGTTVWVASTTHTHSALACSAPGMTVKRTSDSRPSLNLSTRSLLAYSTGTNRSVICGSSNEAMAIRHAESSSAAGTMPILYLFIVLSFMFYADSAPYPSVYTSPLCYLLFTLKPSVPPFPRLQQNRPSLLPPPCQ